MATKMNTDEINKELESLKGWSLEAGFLTKAYKFRNFKETFGIMTQIAFECELQGHHPNWENVYNNLTIRLNTHDADGITEKDFKLAKTIETITSNR